MRITIYIVAVLWIGAFAQILVNKAFMSDARIIEAFAKTDTSINESELTVTAYYGEVYLTQADKEQLIAHIGAALGLSEEYSIENIQKDNKVISRFSRKGANANTQIQCISLMDAKEKTRGTKQYITINLKLFRENNSILAYKEILETTMKGLKVKDYQSIVKFASVYDGALSEEERDSLVKNVLDKLHANVVSEKKEKELYTVYAYTGLVKDYLVVTGKRINLNLVVTYDEQKDKTNLYLATPVLNEDY